MYSIAINGTKLAKTFSKISEARGYALDQLDTASVLAHQFERLVVVVIVDQRGNEHWRTVLGNSYR